MKFPRSSPRCWPLVLPEGFVDSMGETKTPMKASRFNIIVGRNNIGKSRLCRNLIKQLEEQGPFDFIDSIKVSDLFDDIHETQKTTAFCAKKIQRLGHDFNYSVLKIEPMLGSLFSALNVIIDLRHDEILTTRISSIIEPIKPLFRAGPEYYLPKYIADRLRMVGSSSEQKWASDFLDAVKQTQRHFKTDEKFSSFVSKAIVSEECRVSYSPVIRSMRPMGTEKSPALFDRNKIDYSNIFEESILPTEFRQLMDRSWSIHFTGETAHGLIHTCTNGGEYERSLIGKYQQRIYEHFFSEIEDIASQAKEVFDIISRYDKDIIEVKIGAKPQHPITQLGEGIQTIVLTTLIPYLVRLPSVFFIEEPETSLHPGLQRDLLRFFIEDDNLNKHTYFFTTHSNHIIDVSYELTSPNDVAIFPLMLTEDGESVVVDRVDASSLSAVVDALGAQPSSVALVNTSIWVEGPTEFTALRGWIEKTCKMVTSVMDVSSYLTPRENLHFGFVPFSGDGIAQFIRSEDYRAEESGVDSKYLCAKSIFIHDSDGCSFVESSDESAPQSGAFDGTKAKRLNAIVNGNYNGWVLPVREFENLYSPQVVADYINESIRVKDGYPTFRWDNGFIEGSFFQASYQTVPLGTLIYYNWYLQTTDATFDEDSDTWGRTLDGYFDMCMSGEEIDAYTKVFEAFKSVLTEMRKSVPRDGDNGKEKYGSRHGTLSSTHKKKLAKYVGEHEDLSPSSHAGALAWVVYAFILTANGWTSLARQVYEYLLSNGPHDPQSKHMLRKLRDRIPAHG